MNVTEATQIIGLMNWFWGCIYFSIGIGRQEGSLCL